MSSLTMLGTGNAMASRCYNTCFALRAGKTTLLVDAGGGNGVLTQLRRAHVPVEDIHHIFVTHSHTDHILGVIWVIRRIVPMMHNGKFDGTLTIYGNDVVINNLRTMCLMTMSTKITSHFDHDVIFNVVSDGETLAVGDLALTAFDISSPVSTTKQYGFTAVLPDGRRLATLGDEPFIETARHHVEGVDWMLCEAFCLYKDRERFRPYDKNHSTALDAAMTAARLGVKNLVLYHTEDVTLATRREAYTAEAATRFSGPIYVPDDLETITL